MQQNKKQTSKFLYPGAWQGSSTMENARGMIQAKVGFELLSEGGQQGRGTNLIRESIPHSGSIKCKTITKLFDRFVNGGTFIALNHHQLTKSKVQLNKNKVHNRLMP